MAKGVKRIKGKNGVYVDKAFCDKRRTELGLTQKEVGEACGRTDGWYSGLAKTKTTPQAARLLAQTLGVEYEDVLKGESKPKEEQIVAEIPEQTFDDRLLELASRNRERDVEYMEHMKANADARLEVMRAIADEVADGFDRIADALEDGLGRIADALETREPDVKAENVKNAESIIKSMTESTGETAAEKFNRACEMRNISEKERVRALDEMNCQYQWRATKSGGRMCYIVRGC